MIKYTDVHFEAIVNTLYGNAHLIIITGTYNVACAMTGDNKRQQKPQCACHGIMYFSSRHRRRPPLGPVFVKNLG